MGFLTLSADVRSELTSNAALTLMAESTPMHRRLPGFCSDDAKFGKLRLYI
jgi:hypothetical protein